MTKDLDYAIRVIKSTIQDHSPEVFYPYFLLLEQEFLLQRFPLRVKSSKSANANVKNSMKYHISNLKMKPRSTRITL